MKKPRHILSELLIEPLTGCRRVVRSAFLFGALTIVACTQVTPARAATLQYWGMALPWLSYGSSFGSGYNGTTVNGYLSTIRQTAHCNLVKVWVCENFGGMSWSGNNVTGVSSTYIANLKDFCSRANGMGFLVEITFINSQDVKNKPVVITDSTARAALINNGLLPIGNAVKNYKVSIDLINEGNTTVPTVSWSQLRTFLSQAVTALKNNGITQWVTMSDWQVTDYTTNFNSTLGGLGFDFYDLHVYSNSGSLGVTAPIGGKPVLLGEYGPATPWNNNSYASNKATLGSFVANAENQGFMGASAWCFLPDGGNWQLNNNTLLGDIGYYGTQFGY